MIQLDSVTKKFGAFTAVDTVSYTIERGESFAMLGPNGAGKTTIVRMPAGFYQALLGRHYHQRKARIRPGPPGGTSDMSPNSR